MEKHITAPITKETAKSLHAGDYVYVTGTIYTARDAAHKRMDEALDRGEELSSADKATMKSYTAAHFPYATRILLFQFSSFIKAANSVECQPVAVLRNLVPILTAVLLGWRRISVP